MTTEPADPHDPTGHEEEIDPGWPWSFLILVGAGALYLVLRFVQLFNDYVLN